MKLTEVSRGIPHIEDLPASDFIHILNHIRECEATEKLDGAQLLFGIDENGFYTSRESKGGVRCYNESEYSISFPTTYMRAAHKVLEQALPIMKNAGLRPGDQVEMEVLYGSIPNVVPYSEDTNYLIFLRTTEGKVNIDHLKQKLHGQSLSIPIDTPYTIDGRKIGVMERVHDWNFARVPLVSIPNSIGKEIAPSLIKLIEYMRLPSGYRNYANDLLQVLPLNKIPPGVNPKDWKGEKGQIKAIREEINRREMELKLEIKDTLLNHFVRLEESAFGPMREDGGWIEGVVLKYIHTGKMVKIVDKDTFTATLQEAWAERNRLTEKSKSIDGEHSFLGNIYVSMAYALDHPELGTMQAKNYLRRAGTITEERLTNLSAGIKFQTVRDYWLKLLESQTIQLEARLGKYEKETNNQRGSDGFSVADHAIYQRTLETYGTSFEKIENLKEWTQLATSTEDLLKVLVGKQLDEI